MRQRIEEHTLVTSPSRLHFFGEIWFLDVLAFQANTQTQAYKVKKSQLQKVDLTKLSEVFCFFAAHKDSLSKEKDLLHPVT